MPRRKAFHVGAVDARSGDAYVAPVPDATENELRVHAPGRVNLIGEHTDHTGGLAFPMAIDRGITLTARADPAVVHLTTDAAAGSVEIVLPVVGDVDAVTPRWGAYVAAMACEMRATTGLRGRLASDIPAGAGLSSSAALECVVGLALGFVGTAPDLARTARRAEHRATGVPTGIMDQLCIASATTGNATLIDCHLGTVEQVAVPDEIDVVVRFVAHRTLIGSPYADRVAECARAEDEIGPLRTATIDDVERIDDATIRGRARHVVTENQRVRDFAGALRRADYAELGRLMLDGHRSLRDDFDTSTEQMDAAVGSIAAREGVFGARMTGGGFGGCLVALCSPGALDDEGDAWIVRASTGARVLSPGDPAPTVS